MSSPPCSLPALEVWRLLSDLERAEVKSRWDSYAGEGEELVRTIAHEFEKEYGGIRGVKVGTPAIQHGGSWVIDVERPFVFDKRTLPTMFLGIPIHTAISDDLPEEFKDGIRQHAYIWAAPHYVRFVDNNFESIRRQLGDGTWDRDAILSALVGMPFQEWIAYCKEQGLLR
jgi:hypothetical protein